MLLLIVIVSFYLCIKGYNQQVIYSIQQTVIIIPKNVKFANYCFYDEFEDCIFLHTYFVPLEGDEKFLRKQYDKCILNLIDAFYLPSFKQIREDRLVKFNIILPFDSNVITLETKDIHPSIELNVGMHIDKNINLYKTVSGISIKEAAYQIFIGSPTNKHCSSTIYDINQTIKYVKKNNMSIFIHAPFIFNLSNVATRTIKEMSKFFEISSSAGFKGVVFHVGKSVKLPIDEALFHMKTIIIQCLIYATKDCPFLLETPAGQGTETLKKMEDFIEFSRDINNYSIETYGESRFGICLDTCHVFALGYMPCDYINKILFDENGENSDLYSILKLIHFNDSKGELGCCKDRHENIGFGHIPMSQFIEIKNINVLHGIPLIMEKKGTNIDC